MVNGLACMLEISAEQITRRTHTRRHALTQKLHMHIALCVCAYGLARQTVCAVIYEG